MESIGNHILLLVVSLCQNATQTLPSMQLIGHIIKFKIILVWMRGGGGGGKRERLSYSLDIFNQVHSKCITIVTCKEKESISEAIFKSE